LKLRPPSLKQKQCDMNNGGGCIEYTFWVLILCLVCCTKPKKTFLKPKNFKTKTETYKRVLKV